VSSLPKTAVPSGMLNLQREHRSLALDAWLTLRRNHLAMVGAGMILLLVLTALGASLIAPYDPVKMEPGDAYQNPSRQHVLGTDEYGRDLFSRILFGARTSLMVGFGSVSFSLVIGTLLGLVSGFYLGVIDLIVSRIMDVLYAFPFLLLALVVIAILGTGTDRALIAIGIAYIPMFARVCRGAVIAERGKLYVEGARVVGASNLGIIVRHVFPNVLAPVIVQATLCLSFAILAEAALSYLGLGTQPPMPSWGVMLSKGRDLMYFSPWLSIWPGLAIMATVFAFNVFGDGLRDALDPRLRER
jgi:peptide/nickel transport system permease protein